MNWGDTRLPERFWNKTIPEPMSGCWLWTGQIRKDGYPLFWDIDVRKMTRAYHWPFRVIHGPMPAGLDHDHLCRVRCCVNPAHLEAVTRSVNVRRGLAPDRIASFNRNKTHCPAGHEYTPENTGIAKSSKTPNGYRFCRICDRAEQRRRYHRRTHGTL